jgi:two-component system, OmpR family, response regulator BaeR
MTPLHVAESRGDAPRGHVLLVEDEPMIGRILQHKLVREGHRVTWVRDTHAAQSALEADDVDLALVDVTLDRDGLEFMSEMAATPGPVPLCGWAALVEQRDVAAAERARVAGAAEVVLKPFKPTMVAALVLDLMERAPV